MVDRTLNGTKLLVESSRDFIFVSPGKGLGLSIFFSSAGTPILGCCLELNDRYLGPRTESRERWDQWIHIFIPEVVDQQMSRLYSVTNCMIGLSLTKIYITKHL